MPSLNIKKIVKNLDFSATSPERIFIFQMMAVTACVYQIFHGDLKSWLISLFVYILMTFFGGTITYHRLLSHRAFVPYRWFAYVGPLLGTMIGAGSTIAWVATHREHHRHTDDEHDPHSPHFQPWYQVMWGSMFHKPRIKYAVDLLRSPYHLALHKYYWVIHIIYALILYFIDPQSILYAYLTPAAIAWNAASSVNLLNHFKSFGYRNFATPDNSVNNYFTGLLVGGEGFHNNHHASPSSYSFSQKWYELDISALLIKYLLSRNVRVKSVRP